MKIIFISSNGKEVELYGHPYRLYFVEGLGDVEADTQSEKSPYQDGSNYIDSILDPRYISLQVRITSQTEESLNVLRRNLSSAFSPKLGLGTLKLIQKDKIYEIMAVSESVPFYPEGHFERGRMFQKAMINLICPNPYWRSPNQESKPLQAYVGNFKLPMTFPFELGTSGSRTTLYNDGDSPAPVEIEINGPITNPQIFNRTTGEFIRINRSISEGEKIIINTESGQKKVSVISSNGVESQAFGYLDAESTLFNLEIGENEIEHVADSGNRHAEVIVRWQNRYVGV